MGTAVVGLLVLAAFILAVRKCINDVRQGNCAGGCDGCSSACSCHQIAEDLSNFADENAHKL